MRTLLIAAITFVSMASAASAADITWKTNPGWFGTTPQAFCGSTPCESRTAAALKKACPKGLNSPSTASKSKVCGDATVKFLSGSCSRKERLQGGRLYIAVCVKNADQVRALGGE